MHYAIFPLNMEYWASIGHKINMKNLDLQVSSTSFEIGGTFNA